MTAKKNFDPAKHQQNPDLSGRELKPEEISGLLNELQVYQLELEMQNEELKNSYATLDQERAKFLDLYDLAPVGYFILDHLGNIEESNKNGLELLKLSKKTIISRRFQSFVAQPSLEDFYNFLHRMQQKDEKQTAEIRLLLFGERIVYTMMQGIAISNGFSREVKYYITLMDITESKKIAQETEALKSSQQRLVLSAALTAQEKERDNVSRALHDSVCQLLYGIRLNLESLQRSKGLQQEFKKVNALLDQAIKETRQLSYELTPSVLKDFGFMAGIREMAQRTSTAHFQIDSYIDNFADSMNSEAQLYIFRMIQELISNSIKHARATRAEIRFRLAQDEVIIGVSDNGTGMPQYPDEISKNGSGLRGIRNRVDLLNGRIEYNNTNPGLSVVITLNISNIT